MKVLIILATTLCPLLLPAQDLLIKGSVKDSAANQRLEHVVISILKASDSTLVSFTRTGADGSFQQSVPRGNYILLISSPEYADYIYLIHNPDTHIIELNPIPLITRAHLMEEIIISQLAIRIKGDTTEYLADSFRVKPNATVEDLLKELPGIQVDVTGRITAQGQVVQRILVDGDEFFSDDPTIATRNLRAGDIRKVQVFDKKSSLTEITGVDDGQKTRTINLELKDAAKKGYFGKLSAGGLDRFYNFQAMINGFKAKRKLAAFAIASSTQETGFGVLDARNYGFSAGSVQANEDIGGLIISSSKDDMGAGNYKGGGLPESIKAGIHYSNKWHEDRTSLTSNYLLNNLKVRFNSTSLAQNIIEDGIYYSDAKVESNSDRLQNAVTATVDLKVDSASVLKIDLNAEVGTEDDDNTYATKNFNDQNRPINHSMRHTIMHNNFSTESVAAIFRRNLKKQGQSYSVNISQRFIKSDQTTLLNNKSEYFDPANGELMEKDTVDQQKFFFQKGTNLKIGGNYLHPVSPAGTLVFEYTLTYNMAASDRQTYQRNLTGVHYNILDGNLSNHFDLSYYLHRGGILYQHSKAKIKLTTGLQFSNTLLQQRDLTMDTAGNRNYMRFYPKLDLSYRFSPYKSLSFNYSGTTGQPSIYQIQPLVNNLDPMNLLVGNPNLKPYFTNEFRLVFTEMKIATERYLYAGADFTLVNDGINESYRLDAWGRNISQFTNSDGNYAGNMFVLVNFKIPNSTWRAGGGLLGQIYRYANYVDTKESVTHTSNFRLHTTLQGRLADKFTVNLTVMPGYYISSSSLSKEADLKYCATNINVNSSYQLPLKIEVGTTFNGDIRQKITSFDKYNSILIWNAYIEKRLMKDGRLALRGSVFDILDQNKGYGRYQLARGIFEQRTLTWGQYGLLSLTYNFKNNGRSTPEPDAK